MKRAVLFIVFCSFSTTAFSKIISLMDADFKAINQKLALHLELEPLKKATGFYSTDNNLLHGKFDLGEEYTGHDEENNAFYLYKNKVTGQFQQGKKNGEWLYSYVFDDGLDIFERHEIRIKFKNGKCIESRFKGVIGHIMPISQHTFRARTLCTPSTVRDKAWQLWSEQYKKQND